MHELTLIFITLGILFLLGLATQALGSLTPLPRASLMLLFGFLIGPAVFDLLPDLTRVWFPRVANMALTMIAFLLGEKLTLSFFRRFGRAVFWVSFAEVVCTVLLVVIGLVLIGIRMELALLLAGIATATDPAATADVVHETGSRGPFTSILLGVVAIDDGWGIIVFSLLLAIAQSIAGHGDIMAIVLHSIWEIGGAVLVGAAHGIPMSYLTGRIKLGQPSMAEALGIVFLCGGIAFWLNVSFLLAAMVLGMVVANLARHHIRPFHEIEQIEWPFMILFFILAGASVNANSFVLTGIAGTGYIVFRILGRLVGGWFGCLATGTAPNMRGRMGMSLLP